MADDDAFNAYSIAFTAVVTTAVALASKKLLVVAVAVETMDSAARNDREALIAEAMVEVEPVSTA
jgi:hypothetical protein